MLNEINTRKIKVNKFFNEKSKRTVRDRLLLLLKTEEEMYNHWKENISHKLNSTSQARVERRFNKKIAAVKIVIYMLTPYLERDYDEPTFLTKKTKQ